MVELCRKYGMASSAYYEWREKFFEGAKNGSAGNNPDAALEKENEELKKNDW